ncbi:MAG: hypothetical protein ACYDA8_05315 [Deferrisomatales bacterium]
MRPAGWLPAACLLLAAQGCTPRAWYEGFRERRREECYQSRSQGELQRCLEEVEAATYDRYRERRDAPRRPPG